MIIRILFIIMALLLFISVKRSGALLEKLFLKTDEWKAGNTVSQDEEDDDLTGRSKWRLIIAGYLILILFAVFASVSIYTLNQKINTLYGSVRTLEENVAELQQQQGE